MILEALSSFPDTTWILTGLIGLMTLVLVKHVLGVRSMPPGPFPLPILGNILAFRGKDKNPREVISNFSRKYKDIFTLWLGPKPAVFVSSWDLCQEALVVKRNDFSGRIKRASTNLFLGGHEDIIFGDFGPCWETLRRILSGAVRKYSVSDELAELAVDVVDRAAEQMLKEDKPVDANLYIYLILYNVLASSVFGQRFELDDPEFTELRQTNDELNEKFSSGLPSDFMPALRWFYRKKEQELFDISEKYLNFIRRRFHEHKVSYKKGTVRDFTDAVLATRQEAEEEGKDSLEYLTDGNMINLLLDFFSAGTDTTRITILWILLFACEHQDVQKRIQDEIDEHIGSSPPTQSDRTSCPYTYSVITEILRVRPVLDFTLEHKAIYDTELGGYKIPKGTSVLFHIKTSHDDEAIWEASDKFKPERFLEPDGRFTQARMTGYMPFGIGRRACPGEKLALADVFLIVTRLFQNYSFALENGSGSVNLTPKTDKIGNEPHPYNVIIKRRQNS